jgi:hypothetical protein
MVSTSEEGKINDGSIKAFKLIAKLTRSELRGDLSPCFSKLRRDITSFSLNYHDVPPTIEDGMEEGLYEATTYSMILQRQRWKAQSSMWQTYENDLDGIKV